MKRLLILSLFLSLLAMTVSGMSIDVDQIDFDVGVEFAELDAIQPADVFIVTSEKPMSMEGHVLKWPSVADDSYNASMDLFVLVTQQYGSLVFERTVAQYQNQPMEVYNFVAIRAKIEGPPRITPGEYHTYGSV